MTRRWRSSCCSWVSVLALCARTRAGARTRHHPVAHALPVLVADVGVDALVADDRQLAILDRQIDEHARAMGRAMHAEAGEDLARALHRVRRASAQPVRDTPLGVH